MASKSNLRLVSFDGGGGARSVSQLEIMATIMHRFKSDKHSDDLDKIMRPCEHFDLMGGSGTGGLIAIMLARLRMSVEEASEEFLTIVKEVYAPTHRPERRTQRLKECMVKLMEKKGLPVDLKLQEKTQAGRCASFVLASPCANTGSKLALRSYSVRSQLPSAITVIDAVLATCATHPDFAPASSGSGYDKREYVAVGLGAINPARDVITQALELFDGASSVAILLSLGAGQPGATPATPDSRFDAQTFMMNDADQRAHDIERQIGGVGIYFRFSVDQGMQIHHGAQASSPSWIATQAAVYTSGYESSRNISELLRNFDTATRHITLDQLEYVGGASVAVQSSVTLDMILAATETIKSEALLTELKPPALVCGPQVTGCMEGTRQDVLAEVTEWMTDLDAPNILWLKGYPGVGKSAIAASVVEHLRDSKRLGASFFFQRQEASFTTPLALWRTVAYNLARQHPGVRARIIAALTTDESIPTTVDVYKLFQKLIHGPLMATDDIPAGRLPVVVVDALDECGGLGGQYSEIRKSLIKTLKGWAGLPPKFKLIVTSRGESDIERLFSITKHRVHEIHAGRTVNPQSLEDIRKFLQHEFREIEEEYSGELEPGWPGDEAMNRLTYRAAGLFIWVKTVVKFITAGEPQEQLSRVLEGGGAGDIDTLYGLILNVSFPAPSEKVLRSFRSIIGTAILAEQPLPVDSVTHLLAMDPTTVAYICKGLYSVLGRGGILSVTHQSFVDYVVDPERCPPIFLIRRDQEHHTLAMACLKTMTKDLRFNICDLETSLLANAEIPDLDRRVDAKIPAALQYSCMYWSSHLCSDPNPTSTEGSALLDEFLMGPRPLFWIEVLSLMGKVPHAILTLRHVKARIKKLETRHYELVDDILRFLLAFFTPISISTPHIYISALPFMPVKSTLWKNASKSFPKGISVCKGRMQSWPTLTGIWLGHTSYVHGVAYSGDGRYIASASDDRSIRIWDAETGEAVGEPLRGHTDPVRCLAYSPDGRYIASGSSDNTIRIWNTETGEAMGEPLTGHTNNTSCVAYSPSGHHVVSGSSDSTIRIWDVETGQAVAKPLRGHTGVIYGIAYSPEGRHIVSGAQDNTIRVWDAETGGAVGRPVVGHTDWVRSVAYSPDGRHIVSSSDDMTIRIWDAATGNAVGEPLRGHTGYIYSAAYSPDSQHIVSGSHDAKIRIWDPETGKAVGKPLKGHTNHINGVAYSPDGRHIVSGSSDRTVRVWDVKTGEPVGKPLEEHTHNINSVAYSPDGRRVISSSRDKTIRIWDAETGEAVGKPLRGHMGYINSVTYSPDGRHVVSGSDDMTIRIWDVTTGGTMGEPLRGHTGYIHCVSCSPDGRHIVSGSDDNTIRIWDAETGKAVREPLRGHTDWIRSVTYSPGGRNIASSSDDKTIRIWDAETGETTVEPLRGHTGYIISIAYSPDGRHIVSCSHDNTIRIWDAETGKAVREPLRGHTDWIRSVAYSPCGGNIASSSDDKTIRIWHAETGDAVGEPLRGHMKGVNSVAYSPDGRTIVSGSDDKTIRVWHVETEVKYNDQLMVLDESGLSTEISSSGSTNRPSSTACSSLALPTAAVDPNGWALGAKGPLFWVPEDCRHGITCPAIMTIPNTGRRRCVRVNLSQLRYGKSWSDVYGGA